VIGTVAYGFATSLMLIVAIGAQNAFVLKMGLLGCYTGVVCTICFVCDVLLMIAGVFGVGEALARSNMLLCAISALGVVFLLYYAWLNLREAMRGTEFTLTEARALSLHRVVATTLLVTLANPHVYIDTVLIIGSIGAGLGAGQKPSFVLGAATASAIWFYGLGFGARALLPLFRKQRAWQVLDIAIAIIMVVIAINIALFAVRNLT